jgi:hypothetical protein
MWALVPANVLTFLIAAVWAIGSNDAAGGPA